MKILQYLFIGVSFLMLSACSDLMGSAKMQMLKKEMGADSSKIRICCGDPKPPPAFVVDGEVVKNSKTILDSLGTENIAGIDVLMDSEKLKKYDIPDSTNGVVIITTKEYAKNQ